MFDPLVSHPLPIVTPTVHLGGTSRAELLRQLDEAIEAGRTFATALQAAEPHGRDYPGRHRPLEDARFYHGLDLMSVSVIIRRLEAIQLALVTGEVRDA